MDDERMIFDKGYSLMAKDKVVAGSWKEVVVYDPSFSCVPESATFGRRDYAYHVLYIEPVP